jgi:hypothetical protein
MYVLFRRFFKNLTPCMTKLRVLVLSLTDFTDISNALRLWKISVCCWLYLLRGEIQQCHVFCFVLLFCLDHFNWHKYVNCKWNILQICIYNSLSIVIMFIFVVPFLKVLCNMILFFLILNNYKSENGNICRFEVNIMNKNVEL